MNIKLFPRLLFLLYLGIFISVFNLAITEDFLDHLINRCAEGDSEACNEIEILMKKHEKKSIVLMLKLMHFKQNLLP